MKKTLLLIGFLILFVMFSTSASAETQCNSDSDCSATEFCEFENCNNEEGLCVLKPNPNQCELNGLVCGCDGQTYQSDCHRQAVGVSRGYFGDCVEQISVKTCTYHEDCPSGLQCITFPELPGIVPPRIGTKCVEPDPCSYFDCSEFGENSVCVVKEGFYLGPGDPYSPFEVLCTGNCRGDEDCKEDEFCDHFPPNAVAGVCTEVFTDCNSSSSPVCGSDGVTYQNDCLRKQNHVFKNYDGPCIEEISNISCDMSDQYKDTCNPGICIGSECPVSSDDEILACVELLGIGRRCADEDAFSYYPCPDGYELIDLKWEYPTSFDCRCISDSCKDCASDEECASTDYSEFGCLHYKQCADESLPEECGPLPCNDPNVTIGSKCAPKDTSCPEYEALVCGCDGMTYKNRCFLMEAGTTYNHGGECEYSAISEITCDYQTPCPGSLSCYGFPELGLRCAKADPCTYYECPTGTTCGVALSYPGQVICSGTCEDPECETAVSYDIETGRVTFIKNNRPQSQEVTLCTAGSKGILEVGGVSATYSKELILDESKLVMKTSVGNKQINITPLDAISVSETPTKESVREIEIKEDAQKPIYSVKGTKQTAILFILPVTMEVETKVNAETGAVVGVNKPWWSFLTTG